MHEGLGGGVEGGRWEMVPFKSRFSYTLNVTFSSSGEKKLLEVARWAALPLVGKVTGSWT